MVRISLTPEQETFIDGVADRAAISRNEAVQRLVSLGIAVARSMERHADERETPGGVVSLHWKRMPDAGYVLEIVDVGE